MEQTLRSYEPTWRDRVAQWMLGDQRPTAGQRAFVSGLLGSSGTGSTGMGVVDATPIGGLLSAQENAQRGDYKGAALAALPMPVKAGANLVKRAAEEVVPAVERGIIAYHGSPHSFDRFDMSKIGTGEGAQAYGHGLYFADNESVAKAYRDALSRSQPTGNSGLDLATYAFSAKRGNVEEAISYLKNEMDKYSKKGWPSPDYKSQYDDAIGLLSSEKITPPGSMYQVRINADPEHFLDWDKPFAEQSPIVQKAITTLAKTALEPKKGPSIRNRQAILNNDGSVPGDILYNNIGGHNFPAKTSSELREAGIPGIKYLDAGSRSAGEGSRNYVVFDDNLIEILKKYGLVGLLGGGAAMNAPGQQQPEM